MWIQPKFVCFSGQEVIAVQWYVAQMFFYVLEHSMTTCKWRKHRISEKHMQHCTAFVQSTQPCLEVFRLQGWALPNYSRKNMAYQDAQCIEHIHKEACTGTFCNCKRWNKSLMKWHYVYLFRCLLFRASGCDLSVWLVYPHCTQLV